MLRGHERRQAEPNAEADRGRILVTRGILSLQRPRQLSVGVRPSPMKTIPITPGKLTGDMLEAYHHRNLQGSDLAEWGEALLTAGFDSEAIIEAVANPEMHWEKVPGLYSRMCREVGLSNDVASEVVFLKQEVMIEEYRRGQRSAAELMQRFDDLRKRIGFPEPVHCRLMEDNADGTNDSGYCTDSRKLRGTQLEVVVRQYLERAGIGA